MTLSNGRTVIRRVNETSARPHGIEFHSPANDESSYGSKVEKIEKVPAPNVSMTFHIHGDSDHIIRTIKERSDEVAEHVHRSIRESIYRSAIV